MSCSAIQPGTPRPTSAAVGVAPIAARSETLTASAFQPSASSGVVERRKWTSSTSRSQVTQTPSPSTAASSPMPSVTPAFLVPRTSRTRSMNANSLSVTVRHGTPTSLSWEAMPDRPPLRVAYPGAAGSYSEEAANVLFPGDELVSLRAWDQVAEATFEAHVDRAVLPIENSLAGIVPDTMTVLE